MRKAASRFFVRRDSDASDAPVATPVIARRGLIAKVLNSKQSRDAKRQRLDSLQNVTVPPALPQKPSRTSFQDCSLWEQEDLWAADDESIQESVVSHSRLLERPSVLLRRDHDVDLRALASSTTTCGDNTDDSALSSALRAVQNAFERRRASSSSHSSISSSLSSSLSRIDRQATSDTTCLSCPSPTPRPKRDSLVSLQSLRPLPRRDAPAARSASFAALRTLVWQEIADSHLRFPDTPGSRVICSQLEEHLLDDAAMVISKSQQLFVSRRPASRIAEDTEAPRTQATCDDKENTLISYGVNSPSLVTSLKSRPKPPARRQVSMMR